MASSRFLACILCVFIDVFAVAIATIRDFSLWCSDLHS
jgi:hypothetical protein